MSDVTTKNSGVPANVVDDFWGDMDNSDFAIPHVKIVQATSEHGTPGYFRFNNGQELQTLEKCKLIVPNKTRVLYGPERNSPSRCGSDNFYSPSDRYIDPISESCMNCYASQWGDDDPKKSQLHTELKRTGPVNTPLCKETYNLLLAMGEEWTPFFIGFQGTQLKIIKEKLFSRLKYQFSEHKPFAVEFDIKSEKIVNGNNTYYSIILDNFNPVDDPEMGEKMYSTYSRTARELLAKDHASQDAEKDVTNTSEPPEMSDDDDFPF